MRRLQESMAQCPRQPPVPFLLHLLREIIADQPDNPPKLENHIGVEDIRGVIPVGQIKPRCESIHNIHIWERSQLRLSLLGNIEVADFLHGLFAFGGKPVDL